MAPEVLSVYPLYNTSFTLHRVSPLYIGSSTLTNSTLSTHARHLHDILRGESLRGVRVGLGVAEDSLARVGSLLGVQWRLLAAESEFNPDETMGDEAGAEISEQAGSVLDVIYEKAEYRAVFLRDPQENGDDRIEESFTRLPLLLTRMPGSLRETVLHFLATTFDARISILKIPSTFMSQNLEHYLVDLLQPRDPDETMNNVLANKILKETVKDLLVTAAFEDGTALKSMDILISKDDLQRMITRGKKLQQGKKQEQPLTMALRHYIKAHMALDMNHEAVKVSKVACAAFVLGSEGKIKLFAPQLGQGESLEDSTHAHATRALVGRLVALAGSKELSLAG